MSADKVWPVDRQVMELSDEDLIIRLKMIHDDASAFTRRERNRFLREAMRRIEDYGKRHP